MIIAESGVAEPAYDKGGFEAVKELVFVRL